VSWNTLFAVVSPLLIDEASDRALKETFDRFVGEQNTSVFTEEAPELKDLDA